MYQIYKRLVKTFCKCFWEDEVKQINNMDAVLWFMVKVLTFLEQEATGLDRLIPFLMFQLYSYSSVSSSLPYNNTDIKVNS